MRVKFRIEKVCRMRSSTPTENLPEALREGLEISPTGKAHVCGLCPFSLSATVTRDPLKKFADFIREATYYLNMAALA